MKKTQHTQNVPRNEAAHINKNNGLVFEGIISLRALLDSSHRKIERVMVSHEHAKKLPKELGFIKAKSLERGFELEVCDAAKIDALATGSTHGGLIALCGERELPSPEVIFADSVPDGENADRNSDSAASSEKRGFYVMLDGIEDPYNFGYALRSIYAAGADGVVLPQRSWMSAAGIVCRSSAGASERVELYTASPEEAAAIFKGHGYSIVCADIDDSVPVYDADLTGPILLVIGGEKRGISSALREVCNAVVRLDYGRPFDAALSAASAASILAFEVFRQRRGLS